MSRCGWSAWAPDSELNTRATQVAALSPIQLPLSRTMQFRESNLETIQLVNGPTDFDGVLTDDGRRRGRPVVELRLGKRPRAAAGKSRRGHRRGRGHAAPRAGQPIRCSRSKPSWCRSRWPPRAGSGCPMTGCASSSSPVPTSARCCPSCAWSAARRRWAASSRATSCSPSTTRWSRASARWSSRWPTSPK